jgi:hypothetical protein
MALSNNRELPITMIASHRIVGEINSLYYNVLPDKMHQCDLHAKDIIVTRCVVSSPGLHFTVR